jgi:hypothetical protein
VQATQRADELAQIKERWAGCLQGTLFTSASIGEAADYAFIT